MGPWLFLTAAISSVSQHYSCDVCLRRLGLWRPNSQKEKTQLLAIWYSGSLYWTGLLMHAREGRRKEWRDKARGRKRCGMGHLSVRNARIQKYDRRLCRSTAALLRCLPTSSLTCSPNSDSNNSTRGALHGATKLARGGRGPEPPTPPSYHFQGTWSSERCDPYR